MTELKIIKNKSWIERWSDLETDLKSILPQYEDDGWFRVKTNWLIDTQDFYYFAVRLFRPEYEQQFKRICKKHKVDLLSIEER